MRKEMEDIKKTQSEPLVMKKIINEGNSLAVQWLGLCALTAKDWGSIPVQGTKIPQSVQHSQKKKKSEMKNMPDGINSRLDTAG